MFDRAVVNASSLILLSKAGRLDLLRDIAQNVIVPEPVAEEISRYDVSDPTRVALHASDWLTVTPVPRVPETILAWDLGQGESSVIAYAFTQSTPIIAILDDLAARRCAKTFRVPYLGTLALVLAAKKQGRIKSAREVVAKLVACGMYLSSRVINQALSRVGE